MLVPTAMAAVGTVCRASIGRIRRVWLLKFRQTDTSIPPATDGSVVEDICKPASGVSPSRCRITPMQMIPLLGRDGDVAVVTVRLGNAALRSSCQRTHIRWTQCPAAGGNA